MPDKALGTEVKVVADEVPAATAQPSVTPPPKRSPGHRGQDVRDTMAEMAAKAHEISLEAGSKMAGAMKSVVHAAAGITGFAVESARDLVQYMVRRGQMTQDEADKLLRDVEEASNKKGSPIKAAAPAAAPQPPKPALVKPAAPVPAPVKPVAPVLNAPRIAPKPEPPKKAAVPVKKPAAPAKPAAKAPARGGSVKANAKSTKVAAKPAGKPGKPAKPSAKPAGKAHGKPPAKKGKR